jgi:hypothetical protein
MAAEFVRPGRPTHRCDLPPVRGLWWAKVRCSACGSHWVAYGDQWLPEGPCGMVARWCSAVARRVRGAR